MDMRILIAEDELDLAEALTVFFERNQFSVDTVHDGASAYDYACVGKYDAIILDVMMPKMDGIQVLQKLRQDGMSVPIMMLTAKAEKDDRITGFDAGADDYLPKPFAPDELISRVRAMLRRSGNDYKTAELSFGDLVLNSSAGALRCGNLEAKLSGKEFQVLELLMRNPKTVFSADRIMERIWGWDCEAEINVVWVNISNLRKKIKGIGSCVIIRVSRGLGYSLEDGNDP
jgi:DNA-binding response OmpR family regulator